MSMEGGEDLREQKKYESYIMDLKSPDRQAFDEAFQEAAYIAGKKERKPYHEALLEAVLSKVSEGPLTEETSVGIGFVRKLEKRFSGESKYTDFEHLDSVLDRIVAMPNANTYARQLSLEILFEGYSRISHNTVEIVKSALNSDLKNKKDSFEYAAVDIAYKAAKEKVGNKQEKGSPNAELYRVITKALVDGKLDEGSARSFVVELKKEWGSDDDIKLLEEIRDSKFLAADIRDTANRALRNAY